MRQLQVVGISDDGEALLLGPGTGKPSHRLRLDDKLRAAVRGQLGPVGVDRRAESALSPKEMQARLREGASPEEVAKEAGVPVARVLPYAAPVIAERERIVDQARSAVLHRSRGPNSERPLGEVVDAHLNDVTGLKPESVEWSAQRRRDGAWVVQLAYAARGGRRTASWLWRPVERDLTALDASGTRLATEETSAPRRKAAKAPPKATKKPAKKAAPKARKSTRRPAARKAVRTAKKAVAQKPAVKRTSPTPATRPAAKKAAPVRARRSAAKPAAPRRAAAAPAASSAKVTRKPAKPARTRPGKAVSPVVEDVTPTRPTVVPDPVLEPPVQALTPPVIVIPRPEPIPEPEPQPEAPPQPVVARRPGQRVPLPSWSDVLLGVAPPDTTRDAGTRRRRKSG